MLGGNKSSLTGKRFSRFVATEHKNKFYQHLKSVSKSSNNSSCVLKLMNRKGLIFKALLTSDLLKSQADPKPFRLTSIVDITDYEDAKNKIKDHEKFQQDIFDAIQDGISVLDNKLNITHVNSTMQKWYPQSDHLVGKKCYQAYHGRNRACDVCPSVRALKKGTLQKAIVPWIVDSQKKGSIELFSYPIIGSAGVPIGVVEYARNITDHINTEQALRASEQKFRTMVEFTYSWEYWIDPNGNFINMTPSCHRISGYSPDDFYNNNVLLKQIIHPDDLKNYEDHSKAELKNNNIDFTEFRIIDSKGNQHWISHICQPVFSLEGTFLGRRVSNLDVTVNKKYEMSLLKAQEELESQVENRTKDLQLIADQMKEREKELLDHKSKLERVNKELFETNRAVTVLARNIERSRQDTELNLTQQITSRILPTLEELKRVNSLESLKSSLDILATHIKALANDSPSDSEQLSKLTLAEIKISSLIKNGFTNKEIANKLHISLHTVKTHRRNIRKKLKIINLDVNLASHLKSLMH